VADDGEVTERRFQQAYEDCWLPVFRLALAWTNDWPAAEDLAQEAFTRLWKRRTEIDWDRPVLHWLLVTTRRLATDRFRRLRRAVSMAPLPHSALDGDARLRWLDLQGAFLLLTPAERAALTTVAISGLDYDEAAVILGSTAGALRAAVSRARRKLQEA
jgi:RNA polymerase sigma-70 factor (ECF subfamily)